MNHVKTYRRKRAPRATGRRAVYRPYRCTVVVHEQWNAQGAAHAATVAFLRTVPVFATLPATLLAQIATRLTVVAVPAGATIITKGALGECMYIIHTGQVQVHDGALHLSHLGPTMVFGELALVDGEVRTATVTATTPTEIYRLDQRTFTELLARQPTIAHCFIQLLVRNLRIRVQELAVAATAELPRPHSPMQVVPINIDRVQQAVEVRRITETETFCTLQERARHIKQQRKQRHDALTRGFV